MGKTFEVKIDRIGSTSVSDVFDSNVNGYDGYKQNKTIGNIKFEKKIAELDVEQTLDIPSNKTSRIELNEINCITPRIVITKITTLPVYPVERKLRAKTIDQEK